MRINSLLLIIVFVLLSLLFYDLNVKVFNMQNPGFVFTSQKNVMTVEEYHAWLKQKYPNQILDPSGSYNGKFDCDGNLLNFNNPAQLNKMRDCERNTK